MWGEYDKPICCLVEFQKGCVCAAKQSTFIGLNSLFFLYCTRSAHRTLSAILIWGILYGMRNAPSDMKIGGIKLMILYCSSIRINKFKLKYIAFRPSGESIWAHNLPDPPQYQDILSHIRTTFKCPIAFCSITTGCHTSPSILFTTHFFNARCLIIWLREHWVFGLRNAH